MFRSFLLFVSFLFFNGKKLKQRFKFLPFATQTDTLFHGWFHFVEETKDIRKISISSFFFSFKRKMYSAVYFVLWKLLFILISAVFLNVNVKQYVQSLINAVAYSHQCFQIVIVSLFKRRIYVINKTKITIHK